MLNSLPLFLTVLLLQAAHGCSSKINEALKQVEVANVTSEPLILTEYIRQNRTKEAKALSQVQYPGFQNVTSYSGYFTVEEAYNSNLFFWFFPAANDYENAPVVLWLEGGPGVSSLYTVFVEHGPFIINEDLSVSLREFSWHKDHSVLYIDNPVGTGFSFTTDGFAQDQIKIGSHLYIALQQFFTVFPELQINPFFAAGQSYGGKISPAVSYTIHQKNPTADLKINLQGTIICNGWSDPEHMFVWSDYLYQLGLIDVSVKEEIKVVEAEAVKFIQEGNFTAATQIFLDVVGAGEDKIFFKTTGLSNRFNYLKDVDDDATYWQDFIQLDEIREALHVGAIEFGAQSDLLFENLFDDLTKSVAPWIAQLLSHYRILIYNGQLDIVVAYPLTENYLRNLNFSAAEEYKTAKRIIWHVDDRVAGYVKEAGNLTEVLVRNAGHVVPLEQPKAAYELLYKFVRHISLN